MPLHTMIKRDGKVLKPENGWGGFHLAAMVIATSADSGKGPYKDMASFNEEIRGLMERQGHVGVNGSDVWQLADYGVLSQTPLNEGSYVLKERWSFYDNTDGEIFELLPGDELSAWRN